jgi:FtsP/CotA-like multicopper oxidase with cupredoxin domain
MDPEPSFGVLSSSKVTRRRALLGLGGGLAAGLLTSASPQQAGSAGSASHDAHAEASPPPSDLTDAPKVREFELVAEEFDNELMLGMTSRAWGYNGQTPGPEIRATEGDLVRVTLRNRLSVPTTVHWHGVHLRPEMDGPAGLNQAAVPPGESFTYEFVATPAGTRWYHSHADPALQVPMGLYGPLIIEPKEPARAYDREYTLMLGEWDSELTPDVAAGRAERGPRDRQMRGGELGSDMFLLNGRAHRAIPPVLVREGERVLLRMINAGHMAHPIHMHGHSFRIVATDGNPVPKGMEWTKDTVLIGPAERYDLEFDANNPGVWMFHCHIEHHMANGMMTVIQYEGHQPTGPAGDVMAVAMGHEPQSHDHDPAPPTTPTPASTTTAGADSSVAEVTLVDDRFEPVELTVHQGTTVTWINKGADWHSLEAYDGSFSSGKLAPGESYASTFVNPGTFQYICNHHGLQGMIGQIVVSE